MPIDDALLQRYMETFVGFGSYEADFWFVGMEQGGGRDLEEMQRRLVAWKRQECEEVVDFSKYHDDIDESRWMGANARIQPTLGKMIRIALAARGQAVTPAAVREYQTKRFARTGGETLIAELFPLPSRSIGHWIYSELQSLPHLKTRESYRMALRDRRMSLLRERIDRYRPHAVILFGWSYCDEWRSLLRTDMAELNEPAPGILRGQRGDTTCIVCRHPTSFGAKNAYFEAIGQLLA